jgi:hypothetical protein
LKSVEQQRCIHLSADRQLDRIVNMDHRNILHVTESTLERFNVQSIGIGYYEFFAVKQMRGGVTGTGVELNNPLPKIGAEATEKPAPESRGMSDAQSGSE